MEAELPKYLARQSANTCKCRIGSEFQRKEAASERGTGLEAGCPGRRLMSKNIVAGWQPHQPAAVNAPALLHCAPLFHSTFPATTKRAWCPHSSAAVSSTARQGAAPAASRWDWHWPVFPIRTCPHLSATDTLALPAHWTCYWSIDDIPSHQLQVYSTVTRQS